MKDRIFLTVGCVCSCAGLASGLNDQSPVTLEPGSANVHRTAHIYYNVATGERIVTRLDGGQTAPADTGTSVPIWSSAWTATPCASAGYTTTYFFGVDNPGTTSLSTNVTILDYGDIQKDTVVDCFQINWVVAHPDTDTNSDGVGDGVEELAGNWMVWDCDNGRPNCIRTPLVDILLYNLPGNILGQGSMSSYTLDVDLSSTGTFSSNLTFEIGDSDGNCDSAAFCNSSVLDQSDGQYKPISLCDNNFDGLLDSDLDGDGLFDWSWTVRFFQPGTGNDFDSDGNTGTAAPTASDTIGVSFGFPEGSAVDNGDGTWTWNIDHMAPAAGNGEEDRFVIYNPPTLGGAIFYNGGYFFGGFACTGGLISTGGVGYTPPAMFQFILYGPDNVICCPPDFNCDGVLDFFDVSLFIIDWQNGGDYNGDGMTDFFDVSFFLQYFLAGCP